MYIDQESPRNTLQFIHILAEDSLDPEVLRRFLIAGQDLCAAAFDRSQWIKMVCLYMTGSDMVGNLRASPAEGRDRVSSTSCRDERFVYEQHSATRSVRQLNREDQARDPRPSYGRPTPMHRYLRLSILDLASVLRLQEK